MDVSQLSYAGTSKPSRDIHSLFTSFNKRFFWNLLSEVNVQWSNRMTRSAGICYYKSKKKYCSIRLSAPLLKLRPHSDLVDTLLHEMIHAYLFLTNNDQSRDGHGPNFHQHMDRINREAGTNITVYHSFHSEVRLYKQHWWRCDGPCRDWPPFFGMVKRSMNRAPGRYDRWWSRHLSCCGGTFTKIREPIEYTRKREQAPSANEKEAGKTYGLENIVGFVDLTSFGTPSLASRAKKRRGNQSTEDFIDLTDEPGGKKKAKSDDEICKCPACNKDTTRGSVSEHLEICEGLRDIFDIDFDIVDLDEWNDEKALEGEDDEPNETYHSCPICSARVEGDLKLHVDDCLNSSGILNVFYEPKSPADQKVKTQLDNMNNLHSPICKMIVEGDLEKHVDKCLNQSVDLTTFDLPVTACDSMEKSLVTKIKVPDSDISDCTAKSSLEVEPSQMCPVCDRYIKTDLNGHVNDCLNNSVSSNDFDDEVVELDETNYHEKKSNLSQSTFKESRKSCHQKSSIENTCPICGKLVNKDLVAHVNRCMDEPCLIVEFEEPVIEISDGESPVKLVNSGMKVPLPKVPVNNNVEESERRVACRVCGLRFGLTKFNGHVCYPSQY